MRSPYIWFGGKSRASDLIWSRLGQPFAYIEPFAGSLAVLLARKDIGVTWGRETVNDLDCSIVNFWRAIRADPDRVAWHTDLPPMESELDCRSRYLMDQLPLLKERIEADPEFYDPRLAGYWVYGVNSQIGSGWMRDRSRRVPSIRFNGVFRRFGPSPQTLGGSFAAEKVHYQDHYEWFRALADRLSRVRVLNGDWARAVSEGNLDLSASPRDMRFVGILLDPPYPEGNFQYSIDHSGSVWYDAARWARDHGDRPELRIALCGYEGLIRPEDLPGWDCVEWKTKGGYGSQSEGPNLNQNRERIWFSPHCAPHQMTLF